MHFDYIEVAKNNLDLTINEKKKVKPNCNFSVKYVTFFKLKV